MAPPIDEAPPERENGAQGAREWISENPPAAASS
jgi:hypothetical protein